MSPELGHTPDARLRRAREIILRAIVDRSSVTDDELSAAARWIWFASGGGESRPLNLKEAMRQRGVSIMGLANQLGVGKRAVLHWRKGQRRPSKEMAARIADVLKIPRLRFVAAVAGRKRLTQPHLQLRVYDPNEPLTGRNLAAARRKIGLTQVELAEHAGVSEHQLYRLEHGGRGTSKTLQKVQHEVRRRLGK